MNLRKQTLLTVFYLIVASLVLLPLRFVDPGHFLFAYGNTQHLLLSVLSTMIMVLAAHYLNWICCVIIGGYCAVFSFFLLSQPSFYPIAIAVAIANMLYAGITRFLFTIDEKMRLPLVNLSIVLYTAIIRCAFLWITIPEITKFLSISSAQADSINQIYAWPQCIWAVIGGLLAIAIYSIIDHWKKETQK